MVNNQLKNIKKWCSLARRKNTFEKKKNGSQPGFCLSRFFALLGLIQPPSPRSTYRAGAGLITMV